MILCSVGVLPAKWIKGILGFPDEENQNEEEPVQRREVRQNLSEATVVIEQWRCKYNLLRPHSNQKYITPKMAYFGHRAPTKI